MGSGGGGGGRGQRETFKGTFSRVKSICASSLYITANRP